MIFEQSLPTAVYQLPQSRFNLIPSRVWNYWLLETIRNFFNDLVLLSSLDPPREGINTGDNFRFVRYWWEVFPLLGFTNDFEFVPFIKGAPRRGFYDRIDEAIKNDIEQMRLLSGARIFNEQYSFRDAIAFISNSSEGFRARYIPFGGRFCSTGGRAIFPGQIKTLGLLGLLNSSLVEYILSLLNQTMSITVGDVGRIPIVHSDLNKINQLSTKAVQIQRTTVITLEESFEFILPIRHISKYLSEYRELFQKIKLEIDKEVYKLYNISIDEKIILESEKTSGFLLDEVDDDSLVIEDVSVPDEKISHQEIATRWISYSIGSVLARFQPGIPGALGSAIYRRSDFAIGSLPEPSEEEFNQLVRSPDQFAYIDTHGGRHVFSEKVEKALQALALPKGIAVLDEGHEHDLITQVDKALDLMLGEQGAQEVIRQGAGGDLRSFLNKDYFTQYHLRWYRKRPVYWYIQSTKRSFGFVLFHEKIDKNTFYTLQHEVENKRKAVQYQLEDLQKALLKAQGSQRKQLEKSSFEVHQLDEELSEFAQALVAITSGGYEPEPNWIDDGVILRMAPLWSVIPLWKSEPKKYWERLEKGDFDWSHIAMKYWPERVRDRCRTNKSFAIAHGHEEWYEGN